jgi:hypothetical protein
MEKVGLQACEGMGCLRKAMPRLCTEGGAGQGSTTGKAGALRASLTCAALGAIA